MTKDSPNLDLLRSIAVLLVVADHVGVGIRGGQPTPTLEAIGSAGVALFFVHTCLVLMLSLERSGPTPLPFFVRRAFRVYPLALAILTLVSVGQWLGGHPIGVGEVISNGLLVQNVTGHRSIIGLMWSLPYEVQMYLALPMLYLFARSPVRVAVLLVVMVTLIIGLALSGIDHSLLDYVPCFLPGVLAYTLGRRAAWSPLMFFALVAAGVAALAVIGDSQFQLPSFWLFCLLVGLAIPHCREITYAPLARGAAFIAKYSYSIYLTHMFATEAAFKWGAGLPLLVQLALCGAVMVAWARVAYKWIEAPGIAVGVRFAERIRRRQRRTVAA